MHAFMLLFKSPDMSRPQISSQSQKSCSVTDHPLITRLTVTPFHHSVVLCTSVMRGLPGLTYTSEHMDAEGNCHGSNMNYNCAQHVQAASLQKLGEGDISGVLAQAMKKAVSISAPVFFASNTDLFQDLPAAITFGFAGVSVAPCAIPIVPIGIGIFPQVCCPNLDA